MQLQGGREGRQTQARGRGVLEVGAGMGEEDQGHFGSLCPFDEACAEVVGAMAGGCQSARPGDEVEIESSRGVVIFSICSTVYNQVDWLDERMPFLNLSCNHSLWNMDQFIEHERYSDVFSRADG